MIFNLLLLVILIGPIVLLTIFFIRMYKGLPSEEEKKKIKFPLLIGSIVCILCVLLGLRTPTTEFGKFMSRQDFNRCPFDKQK